MVRTAAASTNPTDRPRPVLRDFVGRLGLTGVSGAVVLGAVSVGVVAVGESVMVVGVTWVSFAKLPARGCSWYRI